MLAFVLSGNRFVFGHPLLAHVSETLHTVAGWEASLARGPYFGGGRLMRLSQLSWFITESVPAS